MNIPELRQKLQSLETSLNLPEKRSHIVELTDISSQTDFWQDSNNARKIIEELNSLKEEVDVFDSLTQDLEMFAELEKGKTDEEDADLAKAETEWSARFKQFEQQSLLSGPYDSNGAIVAFHAGAGGVDASDWAEMLLRMIMKYCERKKLKYRLLDESRGNEAGIKSAVLEITGKDAYGWLKSENGVHRLVRISPFDAEKMRHTSFALIEVMPVIEHLTEMNIKDDDLRIDTYLASGHGGQSVNTTYSAVRITHLPTKITVTCQNERSQMQNKETAMKILKSKLHQLFLKEVLDEKMKLRGEYKSAEWSNQIRSYFLHPYKKVKDHRTDFETQDAAAVLDGELDGFVEAYLLGNSKF